jgi:hypothetical protein
MAKVEPVLFRWSTVRCRRARELIIGFVSHKERRVKIELHR